jgi:hypothetical protein
MIELMNGGAFLNLTGDLAYKALEKIVANSQDWDFTSCRDKSTRKDKKGGILELKGEQELTQRMDAIVKRLDALSVGKPVNAVNTFPVESCSVCASPLHQERNCPSMTVFKMEQVNAFNSFQKPSSGPYSKTYNPGGGITLISLGSRINPPSIKEEHHIIPQDFLPTKIKDARLSQRHHLIKPPPKPQPNQPSHWKRP